MVLAKLRDNINSARPFAEALRRYARTLRGGVSLEGAFACKRHGDASCSICGFHLYIVAR